MHVEDACQVVRCELALQVQPLERMQHVPSIIDGKKDSECGCVIEEVDELRGENLVEVRKAGMPRYYGRWEGVAVSVCGTTVLQLSST